MEECGNERREISAQLQRHWQRMEEAKERDRRDLAESIKSGKKSPPPGRHVKRVESERARLEERLGALDLLIEEEKANYRAHVASHRAEWEEQERIAMESDRAAIADAKETLIKRRARFFERKATVAWLRNPLTEKHSSGSREQNVIHQRNKGLDLLGRERVALAPILNAMRFEAREEEPTVLLINDTEAHVSPDEREVGYVSEVNQLIRQMAAGRRVSHPALRCAASKQAEEKPNQQESSVSDLIRQAAVRRRQGLDRLPKGGRSVGAPM